MVNDSYNRSISAKLGADTVARKAVIGDIFEIKTRGGLGYLQYTHDHPSLGQLVRVLPGLYAQRPDIQKLTQQKELYFAFYILSYSLRDGFVEKVANEVVPEWARPFPTMRKMTGEGRNAGWLIGDGSRQSTLEDMQRLSYVQQLTPEQKKLSLGGELWPHPVMVCKLEESWTPERDEEIRLRRLTEGQTAKQAEETKTKEEVPPKFLRHYLYFPKKADADQAAKRLREKAGWSIEVKKGADGENWLALAQQPAPIEQDIEEIRDELEELAGKLHGEYDGWDVAV